MSSRNKFKVAANFDEFMEDREVILTIQDKGVLDEEDNDGDILENADHAKVNIKKDGYQYVSNPPHASSSNIFTQSQDLGKQNKDGEKGILPQYDEKPSFVSKNLQIANSCFDKIEADSFGKNHFYLDKIIFNENNEPSVNQQYNLFDQQGFELDNEGGYDPSRKKVLDRISSKLKKGKGKANNEIDLDSTKNIASDYYTQDEMTKFKIPQMKKPKKKSQKEIISFLEDSITEEDNIRDHGNKETQAQREKPDLNDQVQKKRKLDNYEHALEKAREQTKYSQHMDDEYDELEREIEKQRKKARNTQKTKKVGVEDVVKNLLDNNKRNEADQKGTEEVEVLLNSEFRNHPGEDAEELPVLSTSSQMLNNIDPNQNVNDPSGIQSTKDDKGTYSMKHAKDGTTSVVNVALPSERLLAWKQQTNKVESILNKKKEDWKGQAPKQDSDSESEEDNDEYTQEDFEAMKKEVEFLEEQQTSGSIFDALKNAREKGYIGTHHTEVVGKHKEFKQYQKEIQQNISYNNKTFSSKSNNFFTSSQCKGRFKDEKYDELYKKFTDDGKREIKLEYRDERGRLMTPKEAFRYICWNFHGKRPSAMQRAKREKRREVNKIALQTNPSQTASMKALKVMQQKSNLPYAVLDSHKKN